MFDRSIPVIGFHTLVATREGIDSLIRLIEEALAPKGCNTLIAEMRFQFRCFPEYSSGTIAYEDAAVWRTCARSTASALCRCCRVLAISPIRLGARRCRF